MGLFAKWNEMKPGHPVAQFFTSLASFGSTCYILDLSQFFSNFNQELIISYLLIRKILSRLAWKLDSLLQFQTSSEKLSWENVSSVVPLYLASHWLWALGSCWSRKMPWSVWAAVAKWHNLGGHRQQKSTAPCSGTKKFTTKVDCVCLERTDLPTHRWWHLSSLQMAEGIGWLCDVSFGAPVQSRGARLLQDRRHHLRSDSCFLGIGA